MPKFTKKIELESVLCTVAFACLVAWCWLVLRGYGDPWPFVFNDEFGSLFGVLPSAAVFLYLRGLWQKKIEDGFRGQILWILGCAAMCTPVLMSFVPQGKIPIEIVVNVVAGFGMAMAVFTVARQVSVLPRQGILLVSCLGVLLSMIFIHAILYMRPDAIFLLPVVMALLMKLLLPDNNIPEENLYGTDSESDKASGAIFVCTLFLTGFSFGLYYGLMAVMEPLLPKIDMDMLMRAGAAALLSGICIYFACCHLIWRVALLMWPILVVGYTAWPLLHRESPALSMYSLHLAYIFLAVLTLTAIFHACAKFRACRNEANFLGSACAALLLGLILGACTLPGIRSSFSHGTTVNYIFALLSFTILLSCWVTFHILVKLNFWRPFGRPSASQSRFNMWTGDEPTAKPEIQEMGEYEKIFLELGLTRQQSLVASLLAMRRQDQEICSALNIAPNTLKTHIRNILKKLGINSRHELLWLASRASHGTSGVN